MIRLIQESSFMKDDWSKSVNGYYVEMRADGDKYTVTVCKEQGDNKCGSPINKNTYSTEEDAKKMFNTRVKQLSKVKESLRRMNESVDDDIVMYINNDMVDLSNGLYRAILKYIRRDSDFRQMIVDFCNSYGDPVVDYDSDDSEVADVFAQIVQYEYDDCYNPYEDFFIDIYPEDRANRGKYNVEIFSNDRVRVESKKRRKASKRKTMKESILKEGAGAGYTIHIKGLQLDELENFSLAEITNDGAIFNVDWNATVDRLSAESYYDDTEEFDDVKVKITKIFLDSEMLEDGESFETISDSSFIDCAEATLDYYDRDMDYVFGWGWIHATYDGTFGEISPKRDDVFEGKILDKSLINYIDKAVQGENTYEYYRILIDDFDVYDTADTEDEAIRIAEELSQQYEAEDDDTQVSVEKVVEFIDYSGDTRDQYEENVWFRY